MKKLLRILHLEDNLNDAELVQSTLEGENIACEIIRVDTRDDFLAALEKGRFDIILADYTLPTFDGVSALAMAQVKCPDVPFVFVSGSLGEEAAIGMLKGGATDYVLKERLLRLAPAVRRALQEAEERRERKRAEAEQAYQARMAAFRADIGLALSLGGELHSMLQGCAEAIVRHLDATSARIWVLNPDENVLELHASAGMSERMNGSRRKVPVGKFTVGLVAKERRPHLMDALPPGGGIGDPNWVHDESMVSFIGLPLLVDNRVVGVVDMFGKKPLEEHALSPLTSVAIGIAQVIQRKRGEDKIREQAALLDVDPDAILVRDMEDHILFWNKGAERLYGWNVDEVFGKRTAELLFNKIPIPFADVESTMLQKGEWRGELRQAAKDGTEFLVESHWTLAHAKEGTPSIVYIVNKDITEKKKLEAQFLRAQRMESLGSLAGGIAHDLNNVLAPILLAFENLRKKFVGSPDVKMLDVIGDNARRGAEIVKQVLTFARGAEDERKPIHIRHLISDMGTIAKETFPRMIRVRTNVAKDLWATFGDSTQVYQVLMNLCVNARDAMPSGGVLGIDGGNIMVDEHYTRMHKGLRPGPYIVLSVSDTGTGIPTEFLNKIFDPFFTTKKTGKGTGLGLWTVQSIIKSHGGWVDVYSEVGKGTRFNVYFPALTQPEELRSKTKQSDLPVGQGEVVLVADDEASIRDIVKDTLENYGYKVITAIDGAEAISVFVRNKGKISAVLTDMIMPKMSGLDAIRKIHKLDPRVKIIASSGLTDEKPAQIRRGEIQAALQKPYTAEKLLTTLHDVLKKH